VSSDRRIAMTLSAGERRALRELAERRSEPPATTAARLVRTGLADAGAALDTPPTGRRGPKTQAPEEQGPAWLPASARGNAIQALRERYPYELRAAPDDPQADRPVAERLAALSVWRDELDAGLRPDAREEIAFSAELSGLARWLEERGRRRPSSASRV